MIRTIGTAFLIGMLFSSPASTDPIVVRSGEHEQFTRLVMLLPDQATWALEKNVETAWLSISDFEEGFDLSGAFEIIPRTRLNALVATDSRLELQMNCDCAVTGFVERNGYLVIDIADGIPIERTAEPTPLVELMPEPRTTSLTQLNLPESSFRFGDLLWADAIPDTEDSIGFEEQHTLKGNQQTETVSEVEQDLIEAARENILEAFSAAASRGLVEVAESVLESSPPAAVEETEVEIFDSSQRVSEVIEDNSINIRISSSADVPTDNPRSGIALSGASCPDPAALRISSWGTDDSFDHQIGESNRNLYGEAGRLDEELALSRARLYLHFGFGAEAKQVLDMVPDIAEKHPELYDLSQYFEYGFVKNPRVLHRFPDCDSAFALWGMLSPEAFPKTAPANTDAALLALEALPNHLKHIVGQDLADMLLRNGDLEQGAIAMRSYERLPHNKEEAVTLNNVSLDRLRNKSADAQDKLMEVVSNNTTESPTALIELINERLEENAVISDDLQKLASAYLFELQGTELEPQVLRSLILAYGQAAAFSEAIENIDNHSDVLDMAQKQEVVSRVFASIELVATDSEFLERYFFDFERLSGLINDEVKLQVAERLFDLRFEDEAEAVLRQLEEQNESERLNMLRAKLYLREGLFSEALEALGELQSSEAISIRASALFALGENAEARDLFSSADEADLALAATWLSDNWTDLVSDSDPVFGPVRDVALQPMPRIVRDRDVVERTSEVLDESAQARDALQTLLNELQVSN